jgi:hypothetical protein
MQFENPVNDEVIEKIKKVLEDPRAHDRKTFLFNELPVLHREEMKKIANAAKQVMTVEINREGDIKTMADGTRYKVTPRGWVRLGDEAA